MCVGGSRHESCPFYINDGNSSFTGQFLNQCISFQTRDDTVLDENAFLDRFAGTPVMRAGVDKLRRNARLVLAAGKRRP